MVQLITLLRPLRFLRLAMLASGALQRRPGRLSEGWAGGNHLWENTGQRGRTVFSQVWIRYFGVFLPARAVKL